MQKSFTQQLFFILCFCVLCYKSIIRQSCMTIRTSGKLSKRVLRYERSVVACPCTLYTRPKCGDPLGREGRKGEGEMEMMGVGVGVSGVCTCRQLEFSQLATSPLPFLPFLPSRPPLPSLSPLSPSFPNTFSLLLAPPNLVLPQRSSN